MIRYHARWILPIGAPPIRDGWVVVDRGRIVALGHRSASDRNAEEVDLGETAVLPGLVNAHTHLELSYLRGQVGRAPQFVTWIRDVMAARRERPDPKAPEIMTALDAALAHAVACGTTLVGDISNTLVTYEPLARSPLAGVMFYELIKFNPVDPVDFVDQARAALDALPPLDGVRRSLAAHAPYSVAPLVLRAIRHAVDADPFAPLSVHLAESADEVEFIRSGTGAWRRLLDDIGAWNPSWTPPGVSPVQYLDESGFLDNRVIAVHGVQMGAADLDRLVKRGTTLVTCPRSNVYTSAGTPPIAAFYKSGAAIAVGTDSLASSPDLNIFAELATMHALAPEIPPAALLNSATRQGARALGFDGDYGTIDPGKRARLIAVTVPSGIANVEEYLVSGIDPSQIRWVEP